MTVIIPFHSSRKLVYNSLKVVLEKLQMPSIGEADLSNWEAYLKRFKNPKNEVNIALIGKYIELKDSYKSIAESFNHASAALECKVNVKWVHSEKITDENINGYFWNKNEKRSNLQHNLTMECLILSKLMKDGVLYEF